MINHKDPFLEQPVFDHANGHSVSPGGANVGCTGGTITKQNCPRTVPRLRTIE